MYTFYLIIFVLVLFNSPIMDSERGRATAWPRIVYILSCGGLSVSALGKKKNCFYKSFSLFWGDTLLYLKS